MDTQLGAIDSIQQFGVALINTGDLDPVYVGLHGARLDEPQMARWLLAYWSFYHCGAACHMSEHEGGEYWNVMELAACNEVASPLGGRWPRSAERRHFRGRKCGDAVRWLAREEPEHWVRSLNYTKGTNQPVETEGVMMRVKAWPMFGNWVAFKAADMLERCAGVEVIFDRNIGLLYDAPRTALDLLAQEAPQMTARQHYDGLGYYLAGMKAPPGYDRQCGPQEWETVLCKWASMRSGHYHVGKDIHEVRHGLVGWGATAERMLAAMPAEVA